MSDTGYTGRKLGGELFKPGPEWNGNAKGRPKGSRNKLAEEFRDLYETWTTVGVDALKRAAENKPMEFCKMVASLLPKEVAIKNELSEYTDEQLAALLHPHRGFETLRILNKRSEAERERRRSTRTATGHFPTITRASERSYCQGACDARNLREGHTCRYTSHHHRAREPR